MVFHHSNGVSRGWNAAFGENSASMAEVSATMPQPSPPIFASTSMSLGQNSLPGGMQQSYSMPPNMPPLSGATSSQMVSNSVDEPSFVTSNMWRESIANTYERGALKRGWEDQSTFFADPVQSKRAR